MNLQEVFPPEYNLFQFKAGIIYSGGDLTTGSGRRKREAWLKRLQVQPFDVLCWKADYGGKGGEWGERAGTRLLTTLSLADLGVRCLSHVCHEMTWQRETLPYHH